MAKHTTRDHKDSTQVSNAKEQTMPIGTRAQPNDNFVTNQAIPHEFPFPLTAALAQHPASAQSVTGQVAQAAAEAPGVSNVIAQSPSTQSPSNHDCASHNNYWIQRIES